MNKLSVFLSAVAMQFALGLSAQAADFDLSGEITGATGAFASLTPIGTPVAGVVSIDNVAVSSGSAGPFDIDEINVNVGGFCFSDQSPSNCPLGGADAPITSIDAAALTFSPGQNVGGTAAVTAFSPTFMLDFPMVFDLDAGTVSVDGGVLGIVTAIATLSPQTGTQLTGYAQNFESLTLFDSDALSNDGWLVWGNVSDPGGAFLFNYGPFSAPNGTGAFCQMADGQGGPNQGDQQLLVYNDYQNFEHNTGNLIESIVYQERLIGAADVGSTWAFRFQAKRGDIGGSSTAEAFIRIIDNSALVENITVDMTSTSLLWEESYVLSITIGPAHIGRLLQFGFLSVASFYEPSGIFYDNIVFERTCGNSIVDDGESCDDGNTADGDGCSAFCEVESGFVCTTPSPGNIVVDPSFEAGTPNPFWLETSTNFGTPLCTIASCGSTGGSDGDWWAWFGGVIDAGETGSVTQTVTIPPGFDTLDFQLQIPGVGTTGFLDVSILDARCDGGSCLLATYSEADGPFAAYERQSFNVPGFADGLARDLIFSSSTDAGVGALNFFVDEVRIFDRESTPSVCTESAQVCSTPGIAIPDNDPLGVADSLVGGTDFIADLDVSIITTHTWVGDLIYTLEHVETGTSVVLMDQPGLPAIDPSFGCGNDNIDVVLDDSAGTAAEDQCNPAPPAIGGSQAPNNPLSAFNGESYSGTWILTVSDNSGADTGTLDEWCLTPTLGPAADTDGDGVSDDIDNCTLMANADQRDTDGDNIGNACDPDVALPNDCLVNFLDLNVYKANFFQAGDFDTDNNGDGQTNFVDLNVIKAFFFSPPGPSAAGCDALE